MLFKSFKIVLLALLICSFMFGIVIQAEQKMETVTASVPLPVPKQVTDRPLVIGLQGPSLTSESSQRNYIQTKIECEARGWKLIANIDATTAEDQRNGIESFINQDVDAIVIYYNRMEEIKDLVLKAREKGIGFYCIDTEIREGVIINTTQPNGVVGAKMCYYGIDRLRGRGKVLIIGIITHILRRRCYAAAGLLENDWPALELVGFEWMKYPGWEKDAFDIAQTYITRYGDELDWIFAGWDTPGIFAARAVEEAGLTRDDIFITGIDGGTQAYAEIRKGSPFIATMSQPFEEYTHLVFEAIQQIQVDGIAPGDPGSMIPASTVYYVEPVLTTPENLPPVGSSIHELFLSTYYDPEDKDAWYFWGEPYIIE